jgi:hypothetical protein
MADNEQETVVDKWVDVVEREYLDEYIRSGGAAVKFIAGSDDTLTQAAQRIQESASSRGYYHAFVDPSKPGADGKNPALQRIDRFFFNVTRDFDWKRWARQQALQYLERSGINIPDGSDLGDTEQIAAFNGRDVQDLINQYHQEFATPQLKDTRLSIEFRAAITALGRAQLISAALSPTTEEVLLEWFAGRTLPGASSVLKKVQIFERINMTNARTMLSSFCRWLPHAGHAGLVVVLDFRPYEYKKVSKSKKQAELLKRYEDAIRDGKSPDELTALMNGDPEPDVVYSDSAYMQMLTMLRRFIDEVDTFDNLLLVVLTSPSFYKDKMLDASIKRCYFDYDALQTRIGQEVHDANRTNLAAALVHLGGYE